MKLRPRAALCRALHSAAALGNVALVDRKDVAMAPGIIRFRMNTWEKSRIDRLVASVPEAIDRLGEHRAALITAAATRMIHARDEIPA
jgi:hypothetical protein